MICRGKEEKRLFFPVIHIFDPVLTLENTKIAIDAGANGVFLINHYSKITDLIHQRELVLNTFPDFWVGLNCLGVPLEHLFYIIPENVQGIWTDNAGISEYQTEQHLAKEILFSQKETDWNGLYFGGVAFKYQEVQTDLCKVAKLAKNFMDVVTTSGERTGTPPKVSKILTMKYGVGSKPLAIASGITNKNINIYLPFVDCFLVSTGISDNAISLNENKTKALGKAIKLYK